jgi:hypothetical protein
MRRNHSRGERWRQTHYAGYAVPPSHQQQQGGESDDTAIPGELFVVSVDEERCSGADGCSIERVQAHHILNGMSVLDSKRYVCPECLRSMKHMGHPLEEPLGRRRRELER